MSKRLVTLLFVMLTLDAVSNAAGQEVWHAAIAGGPIYSTQQAADTSVLEPGTPTPGVSGSAPGFVVSGEAALKGPFGVGVELSDISRFTAMQSTAGSIPSHADVQYKDLIVSALAHIHHRFGDRVGLDVVGGVSFVHQDAIERVATAPPFSSSFGPFGPEHSLSSNTVAGTLGFDVGVGIMRHVSIGPTLRAHLVSRSRLGTNSQDPTIVFDLSTVVWRLGGTVRVAF